jgi:tagatose 1,6-diphosphate aldolase
MLSEPELPLTAGPFTDDELTLVLGELVPSDPAKGWVAYYRFDMRIGSEIVGRILVRAARTHFLDHYAGQIGYTVEPDHRGHRYAARSVRLLVPFARQLEMGTMWITCDPSNAASRRSCELAGAAFVEIVPLPEDCDMYRAGDRERCRYRIDL